MVIGLPTGLEAISVREDASGEGWKGWRRVGGGEKERRGRQV
jgi:hypothetical protein